MRHHVAWWSLFWGGLGTWTTLCTVFVNDAAGQSDPARVSASSSDSVSADQYFFEAKAKAAQERWVDALVLLEKAWQLKPSHDIAGNLGQVALKLGRYRLSATFLERCLRLFPPTGNAEQRAQIQVLFELARAHVATVRLHATPQPGEVVLDRATILGRVGDSEEPIFVDPGTHIIQIRRDGRIVFEQSFMAVASATHDVNMARDNSSASLAGISVPTLAGSAGQVSHDSSAATIEQRSYLPVVIGAGVAVVGFVSAALFLSAAHNEVETADSLIGAIGSGSCPSSIYAADCRALRDANVRADARYNWGHAMLGVGGAATLVSMGYLLWPVSNTSHSANNSGVKAKPIARGLSVGQGMVSWVCNF